MNKKNLIFSLILFFLMGAGFLWAFTISPFKEEEKREGINDGAPSPPELFDSDGDEVNFEDFLGKVVFINNWASWCPPCIAEMPTIEKLKKAMPTEEVAFVMVSFDRNPKKSINWMD